MDEIDEKLLKSVATQLINEKFVDVSGQRLRVHTTSRNRLRMAQFPMNNQEYEAIEQNPDKPSRWGKLAREGHAVVQFRNLANGKYEAVSVDGKLLVYGEKKRGKKSHDGSDKSR